MKKQGFQLHPSHIVSPTYLWGEKLGNLDLPEESKHMTCSNEFVEGRKTYLWACRSVKKGKGPEKGKGPWHVSAAPIMIHWKLAFYQFFHSFEIERVGSPFWHCSYVWRIVAEQQHCPGGCYEWKERERGPSMFFAAHGFHIPWGFSISDLKVFAYLYSRVFKTSYRGHLLCLIFFFF